MIMDVVYSTGSSIGVGSPNISWDEAMNMDYSMFQLVRQTVVELRNEEMKIISKK